MRQLTGLIMIGLLQLVALPLSADISSQDISKYRDWIVEMKDLERGPFSNIRWFCNDGSVLPPEAYACSNRGGGHQHGRWNEKTVELRERNYLVANVLAGLDAVTMVQDSGFRNLYAQILIERFLISTDDGWILRRAMSYRGTIQEEDERAAARQLLLEMSTHSEWIGAGFPALRTGVRMLPHGSNSPSIQKVRQLSASLSDRDAGFKPLRARIHSTPGAEDANSVRQYAAALGTEEQQEPYLELANEIDAIYRADPLPDELVNMAARHTAIPWLQTLLTASARAVRSTGPGGRRFIATGKLLADIRTALPRIQSNLVRLELLDLSLRVEVENFSSASFLRAELNVASRQQWLNYLRSAGQAAFGTGVINARLLGEMEDTLDSLAADENFLDRYLDELVYLARAPGWGTQTLRMFFYEAMEKLAQIEPIAMLFIQDQLRGNPLLMFSYILDGLSRDANQMAGVKHRLFDKDVAVGFTALNPGLARGVLHIDSDLDDLQNFTADGIYLLPKTVSELPPVAGILTAGEGNSLSHVQLLARNLGIPNVTVNDMVIEALSRHDGQEVVMAVSKSGLVEISLWSDRWKTVFDDANADSAVTITPDLEKLDLTVRDFVQLDELRASDSGRTVGPKAAKLGELRFRYPGHVSRGLAIPFGVFYQEVLNQAYMGSELTVFDWMVRQYNDLASIRNDKPAYSARAEAFREELYNIIINTQPSTQFEQELRAALKKAFGTETPPGLFVRSDTNVEDLAGFTGAGLNLTLPNVVGYDNLLHGIVRVWASPFTSRAFAWRQSHMTQPEHVYTSILLLESVESDKSGVLVTQDVDSGDRNFISVAVNEGLGGAVDGQAAESLRIAMDGSSVQVLATATAPWRRRLNPNGGLTILASSGSDFVLKAMEIQQLIDFAKQLPERFPVITDDEGHSSAADVEFGFVNGDLILFQLRPFLDSKMAAGSTYLQQMDARLNHASSMAVNMRAVPGR